MYVHVRMPRSARACAPCRKVDKALAKFLYRVASWTKTDKWLQGSSVHSPKSELEIGELEPLTPVRWPCRPSRLPTSRGCSEHSRTRATPETCELMPAASWERLPIALIRFVPFISLLGVLTLRGRAASDDLIASCRSRLEGSARYPQGPFSKTPTHLWAVMTGALPCLNCKKLRL